MMFEVRSGLRRVLELRNGGRKAFYGFAWWWWRKGIFSAGAPRHLSL